MSSSKWIPTRLREGWEGFLHLMYPDLCVACERDLPVQGSCFCLPCQLKNQSYSLVSPADNSFTTRLWGRVPLHWGIAAYHFTRKSPIQKAIHQLKYRNKPDIGWLIGCELGRKIANIDLQPRADCIIPVPLHPKKERERGYNQSAMFGQGLSETLHVPIVHGLQRTVFTLTQTKKRRMERFNNVDHVFKVAQAPALKNKHILLVDDVLTTGATLEMCAGALLQLPGVSLSMATIGIADL